MIVDCHTYIWQSETGRLQQDVARADIASLLAPMAGAPRTLVAEATAANHLAASETVDKAIVLAFKSRYLRAEIPNALVAEYVRRHPDKLVGFAGVDPSNPDEAIRDMLDAQRLGLKGITVSPAGQDFHPTDTRAMTVFTEAARLKLPVLVHQGPYFTVASKMEYARPVLLDEVARELPALKLVIAHLGYPWIDECVVMLGKHPNVFADVSGLMNRPWVAYNALVTAYQYGVIDKLLFGSNFPYASAAVAIDSLYSINQFASGTNLPTIPRQFLRGIVERDTLALLGIAPPAPIRKGPSEILHDDEI